MNTAMRMGIALGGAAVVIAGGSAFTAANTGLVNGKVGYQQVEASGVAVTSTTYNTLSSDASKMDKIVYTTGTDVGPANFTAKLTFNQATSPVVKACTIVETTADTLWTITCDGGSTLGVDVADILTVGLTVTENEPV